MIRPQPDPPRPAATRAYGVERPAPVGPPLPGEVVVAENADRLIDHVTAEMVVQAKACIRQLGDFQLALSGGSSLEPLYSRLMYDPDCRELPWVRTHLWLVEEGAVPFDDERSSFRVINETIVDHSGIPRQQVHPIPALEETSADDYESQLREVLQWRVPGEDRLDFVLLEMGEDGHTAGLYPFSDALDETERLVRAVNVPAADPPERITMTLPLIRSARVIAVIVRGSEKAATLERVSRGNESLEELPIKGVRPVNGQLKWFLDAEACGGGAPEAS